VGLVLGAALLTVGIMLFLLIPILRGEWASFQRSDHEPTEVEARKHVALKGLRDVEYDFRSGKLTEDDYRELKAEMSIEALEAMEDAKAQMAQSRPSESANSEGDGLEEEISRARRGLAEGRTCPGCGHVNAEGSRFCAGCGGSLAATVPPSPAAG
jgi:cytochrome c-type biogenesis protein CcmI